MDWTVRWPRLLWRELALEPPADLARISNWLGLKVELRQWSPAVAGMYLVVPGGTAVIVLNSALPEGRMRFTWAHEIGHHLAAGDGGASAAVDLARPEPTGPIERECNTYAVNLLMPQELVRDLWAACAGYDTRARLRTGAATFGVSRCAFIRRLHELGLFMC